MTIDTRSWTKIGESPNAEFFAIEPGVLAVVPFDGVADDEETARASVQIQLGYLRDQGAPGGTIVFMDRVAEQSAAARSVYRNEPDPDVLRCFALVGGSLIGRAIASVFIRLHRPAVPTRLFSSYEEALSWVRGNVR